MADKNIDKFLADIIKSFDGGVKASSKANKTALEETKKNIDTIQKSLQKSMDKYEETFKGKFTKLNKLISKEGVSDAKKFREAKKEMDKFQDYAVASEKKKQDLLLKNKNKAEKLEFAYQKDLEKIKKQRYETSKTDKKLADKEFKDDLFKLKLLKKGSDEKLIKEKKDIIAKHELVKKQDRAITAKTKKMGEVFLKSETARYDKMQKNMAKPFNLLSRGFDSIFDKFEGFLTGVFPPLGKLVGFTKKLSIDWILKPLASSMGKAVFNKFIRPSREKMLKGGMEGEDEKKEGLFTKLKGTFRKEYEASYAGKKIKAGKEKVSAIYGAGKDDIGGVLNTISKGIGGFGETIGKAFTTGMNFLVKLLTKVFFSKFLIFGGLAIAGIYLLYKLMGGKIDEIIETINDLNPFKREKKKPYQEGETYKNKIRDEQKQIDRYVEIRNKISNEIPIDAAEAEDYKNLAFEYGDTEFNEQNKANIETLDKNVRNNRTNKGFLTFLNKSGRRITAGKKEGAHSLGGKIDIGTKELNMDQYAEILDEASKRDIHLAYEYDSALDADVAKYSKMLENKKNNYAEVEAEISKDKSFSENHAKQVKKAIMAKSKGFIARKMGVGATNEHLDASLVLKKSATVGSITEDKKNYNDLREEFKEDYLKKFEGKTVTSPTEQDIIKSGRIPTLEEIEQINKERYSIINKATTPTIPQKKTAPVIKKTEVEKKQEKDAVEMEKQKIELEQKKSQTKPPEAFPSNFEAPTSTLPENEKTVSLLTDIKDNIAALNRIADRDGLFIKAT